MARKIKKDVSAPPPEPRTAKDLAGAMFFLADETLPPEKRRFTKNMRLQRKSEKPEP